MTAAELMKFYSTPEGMALYNSPQAKAARVKAQALNMKYNEEPLVPAESLVSKSIETGLTDAGVHPDLATLGGMAGDIAGGMALGKLGKFAAKGVRKGLDVGKEAYQDSMGAAPLVQPSNVNAIHDLANEKQRFYHPESGEPHVDTELTDAQHRFMAKQANATVNARRAEILAKHNESEGITYHPESGIAHDQNAIDDRVLAENQRIRLEQRAEQEAHPHSEGTAGPEQPTQNYLDLQAEAAQRQKVAEWQAQQRVTGQAEDPFAAGPAGRGTMAPPAMGSSWDPAEAAWQQHLQDYRARQTAPSLDFSKGIGQYK